MPIFSLELTQRCQKYYGSKYRIELTSAQAEAFLSSVADLYLAVCCGRGQRATAEPAATGRVTLDITNT